MNNGLQLSASLLNQFSQINSPDKILIKWGRGKAETRLFRELYQVKSIALEIYFRRFCGRPNTRNFNLDFYLSSCVGCPSKGFFCAKTKQNVHVWDSIPYPTEFFYPYFQSPYVRAEVKNKTNKQKLKLLVRKSRTGCSFFLKAIYF